MEQFAVKSSRVVATLLLTCLLFAGSSANAYQLFYDVRAAAEGSMTPPCTVTGAQVIGSGGCYGYAGYGAYVSNPGSYSPYGSVPFAESVAISASGGNPALNASAVGQAVVPTGGYLAGFRATGEIAGPNVNSQSIGTFGYVDLRITESIRVYIPSTYDGQNVAISVNAPYEGSYFGYHSGSVNQNLYSYADLMLQLVKAGTGVLADDNVLLGYAPTTVDVAGVLSTGPTVIRSASSTASFVDLDIGMFIRAGNIGAGMAYDVDFLNTIYLDFEFPAGVTADLGILAGREPPGPANEVSEPLTTALLGIAIGLLAFSRRKLT